ncbi:MAG: hypothetical protein KF721_02355 [Ignavibacteriaceae bacterium]|nr:hypothetical protein [Ignavibacteriaceae bacterium]
MSTRSRLIIALSSLLLVLTFFFPLWKIDLNAPQYPEGLGLRIWLHQISGLKPNDLQSINGLNHYIGMKPIEQDSIPELTIMPYIMTFMILSGLTIAFFKQKKLVYLWLILFVILGIVGLYDFYIWGYEYGHNLDPNAPIKVPGMTYQPPLFGSKQLLNINAVSLPSISSFLILISILLIVTTIYSDKKKETK